MHNVFHSAAGNDVAALQARARNRRRSYARPVAPASQARRIQLRLGGPPLLLGRYALHALVGLLVPLAVVVGQVPMPAPFVVPAAVVQPDPAADLVVPIAPLALSATADGDTPVPDSAFAAIDALPVAALSPELLRPRPVAASVAADTAKVRSGPGTNYDKLGELPAGTALQLLAQANGWYQARTSDSRVVWVAAELLHVGEQAAELLPEAKNIPAPPPPKVGLVAQEGLNLRDGPGAEYVGMAKLNAGVQLDLLARYDDWLQVQAPDGQTGWVRSQYLTIQGGVVDRVESVTSIPDPSPALVGLTSERNVNLRGGPGTAYPKLGALGASLQLDLIGRHGDWLKIRTPQGAVGWVSSELVNVGDFIARRVPVVRDVPALPQARPTAPRAQPARPTQAAAALPVPGASAGSAVSLATQFVGARYVWGGAGPDGFDCSGFTQYVYKQFGLDLPHSSAGQYSTQYGTMVSNPEDLRPGDIVFFVNTYKRGISHVGIYIGGGDVVQAMSPKLGVGIASLRGGYWAQHYYGAIRPTR
jgi:cell wall-associated NlpC family hydrolase